MKSINELDTICPYCGYVADRVSYFWKKGIIPAPGDVSFCIRCGEVSVFGELLHLIAVDVSTLPFETQEEIALYKTKWRTFN